MDDFENFRRIDSDGYAEDGPLGTVLLRRMRKQIKSMMEYPESVSSMERLESAGEPAKLYSGVPRTIQYHPRRLPAGLAGVKAIVPIEAGPFDTSPEPAGEIALVVRAVGRAFTSGWIEVDTSTEAIPYELEVELGLSDEAWAQVMVVGRCYSHTERDDNIWIAASSSRETLIEHDGDPYDEAKFSFEDGGLYSDLLLYRGEDVDLNENPLRSYATAPGYMSSSRTGAIHELFYLSSPHGVEYRLVWEPQNPANNEELLANIVPYSDRGPGALRRAAEKLWNRAETTDIGTTYYERPGVSWEKLPRWKYHTEADPVTLKYATRLRNKSTRIRAIAACIGVKTSVESRHDNVDEIIEASEEVTFDANLSLYRPDQGAAIKDVDASVKAVFFPCDWWGSSPFLLEQWLVEFSGDTTDGWTYKEGQFYVGDVPGRGGDMRLVTLFHVDLDFEEDDFDASGVGADWPLRLELTLGGADDIGVDNKLVILGSSIQQYILPE